MKKYTQEEYNELPIVDNFKQCPTGDYTSVEYFGEACSFGKLCSFGKACRFDKACRFGELCSFGKACSFGESCSFGRACRFGKSCRFGEWCSFGKSCVYANINILNRHVYSVFGVGASKSIYGWLSADGWYFQIGCFFGTETQARESINKKYSSEHIYHDALNLIKKMEV